MYSKTHILIALLDLMRKVKVFIFVIQKKLLRH